MYVIAAAVLILATLLVAGVSIQVVLDGLQEPSRSEKLMVRLLAWAAGFVLVGGMVSAVAYCGIALISFLGWLAW